ncbi:hypothetical protein F8388_018073 [Cannabis sativa]|uniref:Sugar transporter n=1 Tax=Cannabis sativa TaxID=3483 RepID=A0A7J6HMB2_CANSA|nr:hypothetical protein F8388_018073 [Cannabis sativa]
MILNQIAESSLCYHYASAYHVGYSSPAQSGIVDDLGLTVAETMGFSEVFCIVGWLFIVFAKVLSLVISNSKVCQNSVLVLKGLAWSALDLWKTSSRMWNGTSVLCGTIPCLVQLLGLFFIPESPRWLAKIGRENECEAAYSALGGKMQTGEENANSLKKLLKSKYVCNSTDNYVLKLELLTCVSIFLKDYTETLGRLSEASITDLFQWRYAHSLLSVNGIAFYASAIFISAGFSGSVGTIAMVVVQVPMTALGVVLMDKSGRRPLLLVSSAGTCLGCLLVGLSFIFQDIQKWNEATPFLALAGVLVMQMHSNP